MTINLCHKKDSQWDKLSVDSGFSSDVDKNQTRIASRKLKDKFIQSDNNLHQKNTPKTSRFNSLPFSFRLRQHESLVIPWDEVTLKDFDHVRHLGGGGYSKVDLLQFSRLGRRSYYALKKISRRHLVESKQMKQFEAEKEILHDCKSRFIPRLYKSFHSTHHVYLLTEACLGGDLFSYLDSSGPLRLNVAQFVIACVVEALDYLHHVLNVIHRDVKTENLLIGKQGVVKLGDFGFCKSFSSSEYPKTFTFYGTPGYVAPEIILHRGHSYSSDYFSLGVVLYEALSCRSPFRREATIDTYKATLRGIESVVFPDYMDYKTRVFINCLCHPNPELRLGKETRTHDWFREFDWLSLQREQMTSPLTIAELEV